MKDCILMGDAVFDKNATDLNFKIATMTSVIEGRRYKKCYPNGTRVHSKCFRGKVSGCMLGGVGE